MQYIQEFHCTRYPVLLNMNTHCNITGWAEAPNLWLGPSYFLQLLCDFLSWNDPAVAMELHMLTTRAVVNTWQLLLLKHTWGNFLCLKWAKRWIASQHKSQESPHFLYQTVLSQSFKTKNMETKRSYQTPLAGLSDWSRLVIWEDSPTSPTFHFDKMLDFNEHSNGQWTKSALTIEHEEFPLPCSFTKRDCISYYIWFHSPAQTKSVKNAKQEKKVKTAQNHHPSIFLPPKTARSPYFRWAAHISMPDVPTVPLM